MTPEEKKEYFKKYYQKNKEKIKEQQKEYRKKNPEKKIESIKKWEKKNLERKKLTNKKWRENNPEKVRQHAKKWRENNSGKSKKSTINLTDAYIIDILIKKNNIKRETIKQNPELIEFERLIIKTKRLCKTSIN